MYLISPFINLFFKVLNLFFPINFFILLFFYYFINLLIEIAKFYYLLFINLHLKINYFKKFLKRLYFIIQFYFLSKLFILINFK